MNSWLLNPEKPQLSCLGWCVVDLRSFGKSIFDCVFWCARDFQEGKSIFGNSRCVRASQTDSALNGPNTEPLPKREEQSLLPLRTFVFSFGRLVHSSQQILITNNFNIRFKPTVPFSTRRLLITRKTGDHCHCELCCCFFLFHSFFIADTRSMTLPLANYLNNFK